MSLRHSLKRQNRKKDRLKHKRLSAVRATLTPNFGEYRNQEVTRDYLTKHSNLQKKNVSLDPI